MAPTFATSEEVALVKEFVLLELLLEALGRDIAAIEPSKLKLAHAYTRMLKGAQDRVTARLYEVRKQMGRSGIKVYEQERTQSRIEVKYLCRGYHSAVMMLWTLVKVELGEMLNGYINCEGSCAK